MIQFQIETRIAQLQYTQLYFKLYFVLILTFIAYR